MIKNILIVGGTSGIGLELARHYVAEGHRVCITGRRQPDLPGAQFQHFDVTHDATALTPDLDRIVAGFGDVHTLVYTAGFRQSGRIDALGDDALARMTNVSLLAPMMVIARLKPKAPTPLKTMLVTALPQPDPDTPGTCATKAGLGMLGAALVRDRDLGKVLVAAPADTRTPFWKGSGVDTSAMLDPVWVAQQIVDLSGGAFKFKSAEITNNPPAVRVLTCLDNVMAPIAPEGGA